MGQQPSGLENARVSLWLIASACVPRSVCAMRAFLCTQLQTWAAFPLKISLHRMHKQFAICNLQSPLPTDPPLMCNFKNYYYCLTAAAVAVAVAAARCPGNHMQRERLWQFDASLRLRVDISLGYICKIPDTRHTRVDRFSARCEWIGVSDMVGQIENHLNPNLGEL